MSFTRFDRYVDRHARSFTERLQELCRMPSVAARGTGMRAVAEKVEQSLQRVGAGTRGFRVGSGFPIIYGECGAGPRCFLVYGHYDVQPVGQLTEWSSGPFAAVIDGGKLRARGASNSKGDFVARVAAVENAGLLRADGCIWDDGYKDTRDRLVINLGFKGIAFLELRVFGARTDLHSKWGGIVPNPAWRLVQALATVLSPKGVITIDGFGSHVAPLTSEDRQMLKIIELDEAGLRREFRIGSWLHGMTGRELAKELIFGPTCTICGIRTGHTDAGAKTILPGAATARLDFRLVPDLTPELIVELLRKHLDKRGFQDVEIIELGSAPYAKSSPSSMVARAAIESAGELYGGEPVVYPLDPASGPVGAVCGANQPPMPVVSFGVSYFGSNPHAPDENIRLDDFIQGIKYFGRVIHRLAALEEEDTAAKRPREPIALLTK